ncbi:MAG: histidinol dehydrogenase, partial [Planctomycetota bacterium]|nr:histidinol dehydrogenase [Planctomycetota bacterium]
LGGAQAIAALAYGTETIRRVDKIVGPGNAYVTMAKRLVFGVCGIDTPAGPSEVAIIADQTARPAFVAADILSQLEHGSGYEPAVLFTTSRDLAVATRIEAERRLEKNPNAEAIGRAFSRTAIFICDNLFTAVEAVNLLAPEHLEIMVAEPEPLLAEVENAGAVFIGPFAAEAVGDYFAGTNHVLPTAGAARFASSLSVADFVKDISIVEYSADRLRQTGRHIIRLAECEGMFAHADAIRARLERL